MPKKKNQPNSNIEVVELDDPTKLQVGDEIVLRRLGIPYAVGVVVEDPEELEDGTFAVAIKGQLSLPSGRKVTVMREKEGSGQ